MNKIHNIYISLFIYYYKMQVNTQPILSVINEDNKLSEITENFIIYDIGNKLYLHVQQSIFFGLEFDTNNVNLIDIQYHATSMSKTTSMNKNKDIYKCKIKLMNDIRRVALKSYKNIKLNITLKLSQHDNKKYNTSFCQQKDYSNLYPKYFRLNRNKYIVDTDIICDDITYKFYYHEIQNIINHLRFYMIHKYLVSQDQQHYKFSYILYDINDEDQYSDDSSEIEYKNLFPMFTKYKQLTNYVDDNKDDDNDKDYIPTSDDDSNDTSDENENDDIDLRINNLQDLNINLLNKITKIEKKIKKIVHKIDNILDDNNNNDIIRSNMLLQFNNLNNDFIKYKNKMVYWQLFMTFIMIFVALSIF